MSTTVQIHQEPDEAYFQVGARAAGGRITVSAFFLRQLKKTLEQPSREEIPERIAQLPPIELTESSVSILRKHRYGN